MAWTTEHKYNEQDVGIHHIFKDGIEMGHVYGTMHPTIPYEVYWGTPLQSQRCMTIDKAVEIVRASQS